MRRSIQSILLVLAALVYAGTAGAAVIQVGPGGGINVWTSQLIVLDVVLNTEGVALAGYGFHVAYDSAVLKAHLINARGSLQRPSIPVPEDS